MVSLSQQEEQQQQQQRTLGFLKPDILDHKTEVMNLIKTKQSWKLTFEQELILSLGEAKVLYPDDQEALWLSSHPVYVFILEGTNVIKDWLDFVGPKDPEKAKQVSPQSLRAIYGLDLLHNVCHASESPKEAQQDLAWLQSLVVDDLSVKFDNVSLSSSGNTNTSKKQLVKPSKLKKPTTIGTSKIAAPSTSAASSSSVSSSSSSTSPDNTRRKSTTKSSSLARPKSSLGSRPSTPSSAATTTIKKLPTNGGKTQETTSITKKVMTQPSAVKKSTVLRPPKVQTNKTRKESKTSRITARSDPSKQSSSDPVASMGPSTSKRLVNAGNISKNSNPGISVLTGRTRKFSTRLDSRKNANSILSSSSSATGDTTTAADTTVTVDATSTVDASAQKASELPDTSPIVDTPATVDAPPPPAITDTSVETNDHSTPMPINDDAGDSGDNVPNASESLNTVPSVSTSFSQHTTESDHDAEVAAATSAQSVKNGDSNGCNRDSNGKCNNDMMMMDSIRVESPFLQLDRRRSSSFSPVSVASSLTRPETPEVDNLRQRFEVLAQSAAATSTMTTGSVTRSPVSVKRGSSITPEMASRIKDLKPRDPVGSRVKSMVEFFMDENLHKWEF